MAPIHVVAVKEALSRHQAAGYVVNKTVVVNRRSLQCIPDAQQSQIPKSVNHGDGKVHEENQEHNY